MLVLTNFNYHIIRFEMYEVSNNNVASVIELGRVTMFS